MQKRVAPSAFAARAASTTRPMSEHRLVRHARVIARRLRAIAAVLGAAAGLDRQQRRELHRVGCMMRAMDLLRAQQQIGERQREQRLDRVDVRAVHRGRRAARGANETLGFGR